MSSLRDLGEPSLRVQSAETVFGEQLNVVVLERQIAFLPRAMCTPYRLPSVGVLGRLTRSIRKALKVKEGLQGFLG